jgi:hypothetical protein
MTAPVFVDANVLVYARDAGDATRQPRAQSWLEWLWREQLGRTSMQVLSRAGLRNPFTHSIEEHAAEPHGGPDGRPPSVRGIRPGHRQVAR